MSDVVTRALPGVVNISLVALSRENNELKGVKFKVGTGVIVDPSGIIITNRHVIEDAVMIRVTFQDRSQLPAYLLAASSLVDLAVLTVNVPTPLPTMSFGNSDDLKIGQPVIAIGNPIGVGTSVSTGSVSAVNRDLMRSPFDDFIQTDAAINPGNSGGPLLDCSGKVIGINTALLSNNTLLGSIGLGFAMPSNDVKFVSDKLRDPRGMPSWLGLHLQDVSPRLAMLFHKGIVSGAIVTGLEPSSPAEKAAIRPGDIISGVQGKMLADSRAIGRALVETEPGTPIVLSVWRRGAMMDVTVIGEPSPGMKRLQSDVVASRTDITTVFSKGPGVHVSPISDEARKKYALGDVQGVLIDDVRPGSCAENLGLKVGEVIKQVGDQPATTPEQVMKELSFGKPEADELVAVLVHKPAGSEWVTLWVGSPDSHDLVLAGPHREPEAVAQGSTTDALRPGARDAAAEKPGSTAQDAAAQVGKRLTHDAPAQEGTSGSRLPSTGGR